MTDINSESQIYLRNSAESIRRILVDNWDIGNVALPLISTQTDTKRVNLRDQDYITIDKDENIEQHADIFRDYINTIAKIKLSVYTIVDETRLEALFTEIKRILYSKRRAIGYDSFDILGNISRTNRSHTKRKFYLIDITFDIREVVEALE